MSGSESTQWTLIRQAQGQGPPARAALGELLERYDSAITALIRSYRHPPGHSPEELKQEFLVRVLERGDLLKLDQSKGGFRRWLAVAVRHHLLNCWDAWWTLKNPERHTCKSDTLEIVGHETPEHVLLRKFAVDTLRAAHDRLWATRGRRERSQALRRFLPGPDMDLEAAQEVAERLGTNPGALRKEIHDLRKRFVESLQRVVAETLELDPDDPDDPGAAALVQRELLDLYSSLFASEDSKVL